MMFDKKNSFEAEEADLQQVLQSFRQSVHAWSEAEYGRPRSLATATVHHTWRMATAWALGCVLAVGGLGVGLYESHHQKETAKSNAVQQRPQQQAAASVTPTAAPTKIARVVEAPMGQMAQVDASEPDANLLSAVDNDVSRQVPSALEPLAQLMENNPNQ